MPITPETGSLFHAETHPDRAQTVLPALASAIVACEAALDDAEEFARCARSFHERIVASCGNEPLILLVGTVEGIWSSQFADEAVDRTEVVLADRRRREEALARHRLIYTAIEAGDEQQAERIVREHYANRPRGERIGRKVLVRARRV